MTRPINIAGIDPAKRGVASGGTRPWHTAAGPGLHGVCPEVRTRMNDEAKTWDPDRRSVPRPASCHVPASPLGSSRRLLQEPP